MTRRARRGRARQRSGVFITKCDQCFKPFKGTYYAWSSKTVIFYFLFAFFINPPWWCIKILFFGGGRWNQCEGPWKGLFRHMTLPKIKAKKKKKADTDTQNSPRHSPFKRWKLYQVDTLHCDFQVDPRNCKIFDLDTWHWPPFKDPNVENSTWWQSWNWKC